jgi:hypothetical protein
MNRIAGANPLPSYSHTGTEHSAKGDSKYEQHRSDSIGLLAMLKGKRNPDHKRDASSAARQERWQLSIAGDRSGYCTASQQNGRHDHDIAITKRNPYAHSPNQDCPSDCRYQPEQGANAGIP